MKCDNVFCIYQSKGECTAEEISVDACGMCTECVYPNIDEMLLEKAKTELLNKYERSE